MSADLLPCPFCGGEAYLENTVTEAMIRCCSCGSSLKRRHINGPDSVGIEQAAEHWNRRAPTDAEERGRLKGIEQAARLFPDDRYAQETIRTGVKPIRIQRRRTKGWCMPPNTVYVGRPGRFGNPFRVGQDAITHGECVSLFRQWLTGELTDDEIRDGWDQIFADWFINCRAERIAAIPQLCGKNLACWCPLDQPCHADVLLELANKEPIP